MPISYSLSLSQQLENYFATGEEDWLLTSVLETNGQEMGGRKGQDIGKQLY